MNKNLMTATMVGVAITSVLSTVGEAEATSGRKMKVCNTNSLKILSRQDQNKTVEVLSEGSVVTIIESMKNQPGWYYVQTSSGKKGVCSGLYLKSVGSQTQSAYYTKTKLNLRKGMGTQHAVLKYMPAGAKVELIETYGNGWAKIKYSGTEGYCSANYLEKRSTSNQSTQSTQSSTKTYYATTNGLNIRTGVGTSYPIYKTINAGTSVEVITNRKDGWSEIKMDAKKLYVNTSYLSTTKPSSQSSTKTYYATTNGLNIRTGVGVSYSIYKTINTGDSVEVITNRKDGWSEIKMDGKKLYVNTSYLSTTKPQSTRYPYVITSTTTTTKSNSNSIKNVINAFKKIDGKIINPGQTFSYLGTIGGITKANGFIESTVISGGKPSTGIGGGICLGSTAIHNAVMKSGLTVTERRNHSLPSSYVSKGMDAMVTSSSNLDYKFKNTSKYPIRIRAYVSNGQAVVKLESTGDITGGYTFKPEAEVSADGLKATTTVWKMKDGKKISVHQKFYSSYRSA